jgi:hypothetical protein
MLAIHAHEAYEVLLRHHIVELIGLYLGDEFKATKLSGGVIDFIGVTMREREVESILLSFGTGTFRLESTSNAYSGPTDPPIPESTDPPIPAHCPPYDVENMCCAVLRAPAH